MLDEARWQRRFSKKYAPMKFNVISAGTIPSSQLNPLVVKVMLHNNQNYCQLFVCGMLESGRGI